MDTRLVSRYHLSSAASGSACDGAISMITITHSLIIESVLFVADSTDYGGNLLLNINCSSGTFSLSNQQDDVEIVWVTVESRCNGTGIVNQQVSRRNVINSRLVSSQLCHSTSKFLPGCYRFFIGVYTAMHGKKPGPLAQHCTALDDNVLFNIELLN